MICPKDGNIGAREDQHNIGLGYPNPGQSTGAPRQQRRYRKVTHDVTAFAPVVHGVFFSTFSVPSERLYPIDGRLPPVFRSSRTAIFYTEVGR